MQLQLIYVVLLCTTEKGRQHFYNSTTWILLAIISLDYDYIVLPKIKF